MRRDGISQRWLSESLDPVVGAPHVLGDQQVGEVLPVHPHIGEDLKAFVLSVNIHRRHMTRGQRAMAVAVIYPETRQGKRSTSFVTKKVTAGGLSKARTVLQYAGDLAESVLAGATSLDQAYETARGRPR